MTAQEQGGRGTRTDRKWTAGAVCLWVIAAALAAVYLLTSPTSGDTTASGLGIGTAVVAAPSTISVTPSTTTTEWVTTTIAPPAAAATTTTAPSITTTTTSPPLLFAAGGDVMGDRKVGVFIDANGGDAVLSRVKPYLESAHLAFVNLESPISDKGARKTGKQYTFRSRTALAGGLAAVGIDVVSLANNHALDYGAKALLDTLERLDKVGVAYAGAGADRGAAEAPALLITPAGIVKVLAFTEIIPGGFAATSEYPGVNATTLDRERVSATIAAAAETADFVAVSFHWGTEYTGQATREQRRLAHRAVDAGADLVLGHHPHVIQGLELYRGHLIAYSLGDFVFDHYSRITGEAFVLQVSLPKEGPPSFTAVPVYLDESGVPAPVSGEEADVILSRLSRLSADLGLVISREGDLACYTPEPRTGSAVQVPSMSAEIGSVLGHLAQDPHRP